MRDEADKDMNVYIYEENKQRRHTSLVGRCIIHVLTRWPNRQSWIPLTPGESIVLRVYKGIEAFL